MGFISLRLTVNKSSAVTKHWKVMESPPEPPSANNMPGMGTGGGGGGGPARKEMEFSIDFILGAANIINSRDTRIQ